MFQEIAENIWFIQGKNRGQYPYSNSLYINDKKKLLIDTGIGRSIIRKLLKQFGQPDIILYSHWHEDHMTYKDLFKSTRYIHEKDKHMVISKEKLYRGLGMNTQKLIHAHESFLKAFNYQPLDAVDTFIDGQVFDLGNYQVKVFHTPGHSAGHVCFEFSAGDLIFASDIDLRRFGPWYGGLDSDIHAFQRSIDLLIQKSPGTLISSHMGIITEDIPTSLTRFSSIIEKRTRRLLDFLKEEHSLPEIIPQALIHGKFFKPQIYKTPRIFAAERMMLQKHLELLLATKKIEVQDGRFRSI